MSPDTKPLDIDELCENPRAVARALMEAVQAFNASDNGKEERARLMRLVGFATVWLIRAAEWEEA